MFCDIKPFGIIEGSTLSNFTCQKKIRKPFMGPDKKYLQKENEKPPSTIM